MASLSLCSSLTSRISHVHALTLSPSKSNFGFISQSSSLSSHRLISWPSSAPKSSALPFVPKFSDAESSVIEVEPEPEAEPSQAVVPSIEGAKREEIFAVVMVGGRQYIVFPGRFIYTQRFKGANINDKVILNKVLLVGTKTSTFVGKPVVTNAAVHAVVEEQGLNKKVIVFKYKKKKRYRRNIGHRQPNTRIRILGISGYEDYPATTVQ